MSESQIWAGPAPSDPSMWSVRFGSNGSGPTQALFPPSHNQVNPDLVKLEKPDVTDLSSVRN